MRFLAFVFTFFGCTQVFGLYLLICNGEVPYELKRQAYLEVLLKEDYPLCLAKQQLGASQEEMDERLKQIAPQLRALWVPTSLFQLFVVHFYFFEPAFQEYIKKLGYSCGFYDQSDPDEVRKFEIFCKERKVSLDLNIDDKVIKTLSNSAKSARDLFALYERLNTQEDLIAFFLKINDAFIKRYSERIIEELLREILQEINDLNYGFLSTPFTDVNVQLFLRLFKEKGDIIKKVIAEEWKARELGKVLLYRGSEVIFLKKSEDILPLLFLPVKAKNLGDAFVFEKGMSSFSLSYANSLFGGLFFSLGACAARYSQSDEKYYVFHALRLDRTHLIDDPLFCIPPLHPFTEMLVDGEWFHPHSKIAKRSEDPRCYGWYAKINRTFTDHQGFLIRSDCSPEELGAKLLELAAENAVLIHMTPHDFPLVLKDHEQAIKELIKEDEKLNDLITTKKDFLLSLMSEDVHESPR